MQCANVSAGVTSPSACWSRPSLGDIKVNIDTHIIISEEGYIGLGVVGRDQHGVILFVAVRRINANWRLGYIRVVLESTLWG